jgi:hypothetical protein
MLSMFQSQADCPYKESGSGRMNMAPMLLGYRVTGAFITNDRSPAKVKARFFLYSIIF